VTAMSYASSSSIKRKKIQKKRNIKSRKIDKRKRKMLVSKVFYNTTDKTEIEVDSSIISILDLNLILE